MADGEWTVITKKSKIKPFKKSLKRDNDKVKPKDIQDKLPAIEPFISLISNEITSTKPDCVCYGIGSLSQKSSQYQLALLLLLQPCFEKIYIYDPIMTPNEIQYYNEIGLKVLDTFTDGKYKAVKPTVFYMPHCDNFLYEAVLEANFDNLHLINILGNSFQTYKEMLIELPYPHLIKSFNLVTETRIEINVGTAFNNLSWHSFRNEMKGLEQALEKIELQ